MKQKLQRERERVFKFSRASTDWIYENLIYKLRRSSCGFASFLQEENTFALKVERRGPARDSPEDLFMCNTMPELQFLENIPAASFGDPGRSTCILDAFIPARFRIPQTRSGLVWRITFPEILSRYLQKEVSHC